MRIQFKTNKRCRWQGHTDTAKMASNKLFIVDVTDKKHTPINICSSELCIRAAMMLRLGSKRGITIFMPMNIPLRFIKYGIAIRKDGTKMPIDRYAMPLVITLNQGR